MKKLERALSFQGPTVYQEGAMPVRIRKTFTLFPV
jgi:hypothetical protein